MDQSTSASSVTRAERPDIKIANYPNPFNSHFTLRVDGEANQTFSVDIVGKGSRMLRTVLPCNVDHVLGQSWESGLYVVHIVHNNKSTVRKLIKIK